MLGARGLSGFEGSRSERGRLAGSYFFSPGDVLVRATTKVICWTTSSEFLPSFDSHLFNKKGFQSKNKSNYRVCWMWKHQKSVYRITKSMRPL